MTSPTLKLYRRHSDYCRQDFDSLEQCECPLWLIGSHNDKPVRQSLKTRDLIEAREKLSAFATGNTPINKRSTIENTIRAYIRECELNGLAPSTVRSYMNTLSPLDAFFKDRSIERLTTQDVLDYRAHRNASNASAGKELQHLRTFFAWCGDRGFTGYNLTHRMKAPRSDSKPTLPFTKDQVVSILAACDRVDEPEYARSLVLGFLYTGLRISDMTEFSPTKLDGSRAKLRQAKTGEWVTVALPPQVLTALEAIKPAVPTQPYFRKSGITSDSAIDSNRKLIARLGYIAGVPDCHPHRFRDTFAVELLLAGEDIRTVQILLGHASVKTTESHYAPFVPAFQEKLDSATAKLSFGL